GGPGVRGVAAEQGAAAGEAGRLRPGGGLRGRRRRPRLPRRLRDRGATLRDPDPARPRRRHDPAARPWQRPHADARGGRQPRLYRGYPRRRPRAGPLDLQPLDQLPLGHALRLGAAANRPRREDGRPVPVQRETAAGPLGRRPPDDRAGVQGHRRRRGGYRGRGGQGQGRDAERRAGRPGVSHVGGGGSDSAGTGRAGRGRAHPRRDRLSGIPDRLGQGPKRHRV
ncbi:MAG: Pyridoxamine 5'-phosphate oxidase-related, FMN-binding, partial [uncultured Thermomicrobiales bacterium]